MSKSNYIDPLRVSKSVINDIKRQGFVDDEIERMTVEDAFHAYCNQQGKKDLGKWSTHLIKVTHELEQSCIRQ